MLVWVNVSVYQMDSRLVANEVEDKKNVVNISPIIAQAKDSLQEETMAESLSAIVPNVQMLEIFQFHYHLCTYYSVN